jgi:hypothetical protein
MSYELPMTRAHLKWLKEFGIPKNKVSHHYRYLLASL